MSIPSTIEMQIWKVRGILSTIASPLSKWRLELYSFSASWGCNPKSSWPINRPARRNLEGGFIAVGLTLMPTYLIQNMEEVAWIIRYTPTTATDNMITETASTAGRIFYILHWRWKHLCTQIEDRTQRKGQNFSAEDRYGTGCLDSIFPFFTLWKACSREVGYTTHSDRGSLLSWSYQMLDKRDYITKHKRQEDSLEEMK